MKKEKKKTRRRGTNTIEKAGEKKGVRLRTLGLPGLEGTFSSPRGGSSQRGDMKEGIKPSPEGRTKKTKREKVNQIEVKLPLPLRPGSSA